MLCKNCAVLTQLIIPINYSVL